MSLLFLMNDRTSLGVGETLPSGNTGGRNRSFQVGIKGTGFVSAVVKVYGMNDGRFPTLMFTFTLSGQETATESDHDDFPWEYLRAEVESLTGNGTAVTVAVGG
jgi:hypothetical protein